MKNLRSNGGFSLVELMIVIVIIGVLAAVAVPIYNNNVRKAKMSEADAALGSIRTQLRVYYGENGTYPTAAVAEAVVGASWNDIKATELTGAYFVDANYTYLSADGSAYTLTCAANGILDSDRTLSDAGVFAGGI
jgi:prepilin-type N-terminal cleavage/methylation domain-containing protein